MTIPGLALLAAIAAAPAVPVTAVVDAYPMLSPDGTTLLFQSTRSGRTALWFADADGSRPRIFLDSGDDPSVAVWSPDGRRIAFAATVGSEPEIFVIDRDGKNRRRLTDDPGDDSHPHWSADGARIFFNSARATPDRSAAWNRQHHDIWSIRADGEDLVRHTRCAAVCTYGVPSPDGTMLAYRRVDDTPGFDWALASIPRNSEVYVAKLDGSDARNITNHAAFDGWPAWSPDGAFVVVSSNRTGRPNAGQLHAIRLADGHVTALTEGDAAHVQARFAGADALHAARVVAPDDGGPEQAVIVRIAFGPPR